LNKIGLGGGCHWCTEAVFQSLYGVHLVEQGYVASGGDNFSFSEAVIVHFNSRLISLKDLIEIHLYTHKSTSNHSMRDKYRSAIYTYSKGQFHEAKSVIDILQMKFKDKLITKIYSFNKFVTSREEITNYYYSNPNKPFCENYINPKMQLLMKKFSKHLDYKKLEYVERTRKSCLD